MRAHAFSDGWPKLTADSKEESYMRLSGIGHVVLVVAHGCPRTLPSCINRRGFASTPAGAAGCIWACCAAADMIDELGLGARRASDTIAELGLAARRASGMTAEFGLAARRAA
mmetsp:Transcript_108116/g.176652  ORF Transcript_108116/g.176652 Transcript_108116/m.176652 type:complete len:113 (-) Transcript_108116:678-1016(-)